MLEDLRKFVAPEFITGISARNRVGQYARNLGLTKVLVVTDFGVHEAGWAKEAIHDLEEAGIEHSLFMGLTPNPKDHEIHVGVNIYNTNGCDGIVAVGGGSAIDCAKGIGIIANNGGSILDYEGVDTIESPCPPLICIPTTSGTSADVSQFAIIRDSVRRVKMAIVSKALVPDVSLIDPLTTSTMPPLLTSHTGLDALTHSCEALVSNASSSITTMHALESIRLIKQGLKPAYENGEDLEARSKMMLGSLHAGLAFSNASLGAVHAMAHALGGLYDSPHGECNAILLPHVIKYNYPTAENEYNKACQIFTPNKEPSCELLVSAIKELMYSVGVTKTLSQIVTTQDDLPALAELSLKDACMATNPRTPTSQEIIGIFKNAF